MYSSMNQFFCSYWLQSSKSRPGQLIQIFPGELKNLGVLYAITQHICSPLSLKHTHISPAIPLHSCCVSAKLLQSCLTLCDIMDCSPRGSSVHGSKLYHSLFSEQLQQLHDLPCFLRPPSHTAASVPSPVEIRSGTQNLHQPTRCSSLEFRAASASPPQTIIPLLSRSKEAPSQGGLHLFFPPS